MKLREFLNEENWCQGWTAKDVNGDRTAWNSPTASKYSLMGALHYLYPDTPEYLKGLDRVASLVRILHGHQIEVFNDMATWDQIEHIIFTVDL